jgi:hypothetical protein
MLQPDNRGPFISQWQFRVDNLEHWRNETQTVVNHLATMAGFNSAHVARYVDDAQIVTLTIMWQSVGTYRKALSASSSKILVWPYLANATEVPGAFEVLDEWTRDEHRAFDSSVAENG